MAEFGDGDGNSQLRAVKCSFQPLLEINADKLQPTEATCQVETDSRIEDDTDHEIKTGASNWETQSTDTDALCDSTPAADDVSRTDDDVSHMESCGIDPDCTECSLCRSDPQPHNLVMYLHALRYKVRIADITALFLHVQSHSTLVGWFSVMFRG